MKFKIVILAALVVITSSDYTKSKKVKKSDKRPKKINVTNWESYRLNQEIQVKSLKEVLDSMAKFKKLESCPLGFGNCRDASVKYVLTRIITAAIKKEKDEVQAQEDRNKTMECEALLNKTQGNETTSTGQFVLALPADVPTPEEIMKLKTVILAALVVITTSNDNNKKTKSKNQPSKINITNWEEYNLKQEIEVKSLKKILESISKFLRLEECPLGPNQCLNTTVKYVVTKIIAAVIENEKEEAQKEKQNNTAPYAKDNKHKKEGNKLKSRINPDSLKFDTHYRKRKYPRWNVN